MNFVRLTSLEQVRDIIAWHNQHSDFIAIDCETTSKKPREAQLLDIQLSGKNPEDAVIFAAKYSDEMLVLDPKVLLVGHNYGYDAHVLFLHGVDLLSRSWRDTMLLAHLANENRESYSLDSFVTELWGDFYKQEFWAKYTAYQDAPQAEADTYAMKDVYYTRKLYLHLTEELKKQCIY